MTETKAPRLQALLRPHGGLDSRPRHSGTASVGYHYRLTWYPFPGKMKKKTTQSPINGGALPGVTPSGSS